MTFKQFSYYKGQQSNEKYYLNIFICLSSIPSHLIMFGGFFYFFVQIRFGFFFKPISEKFILAQSTW